MKKLFLLTAIIIAGYSFVFAQRNISGKVTDKKDGTPLPGVSVVVKGGGPATQTDFDGNFSLTNVAVNAKIIFSLVSYKTYESQLSSANTMNIALEEDAQQLNEVIVTAIGVKREARSLGYATTTINNEELTKGKDRSVLNSLQGKVAGVQITSSSGGVGSSTRIVFRGGTSITGNNQALLVVDGIPIDNSATDEGDNLNNQVDAGNRGNDINPEDIESVTLLKGPAAAVLYGSRAANGALIITTKTGKSLKGKRSEIIASSFYNFESILKLPDFQNQYGQGGRKQPDSRENFSWGPRFDGIVRPWGQRIGDSQRVKPYVALPDNVKDFFDLGSVFTNNISFAQNNDKNSYYMSLNNIEQKGVMPGTEYKRTGVKLSGTADITDKIYTSATINYIRSSGDLSIQGQGNSPYNQILQTPRDISLLELEDYKNKFNDLDGYYGAFTTNPWYLLGEDSYTSLVDRVLGNLQVGYKPLSWLDISFRIGTDISNDKRVQIESIRTPDPAGQNSGNDFAGHYSETSIYIRELTTDLIAIAKRQLTGDLSLSVLVGHNVRQRNTNVQFSEINSLVIPLFYNLANSDQPPQTANAKTVRRLHGVYADINLSYKNYLFLGLTGRNDWSSTLEKSNNTYFYPGVNTSFLVSEAFSLPKVISYAKIRAGAAQVGNDANPYLLQSVFISGNISDGFDNSLIDFPLNGIPGFTQGNNIGNPDLTPEITTSYELGLELGLFNNRLNFDATIYSNRSKDQIIGIPIASSTGFSSATVNAGLITNKGIELLLRGTPVRGRDFSWEVTGTFTKNENKVKEVFPGTDQVVIGGFVGATLVAEVGQPYGSFFGAGFLRSPEGNIVVDEGTGFPITEPQAAIHGNIQPDFLAGLNNSFSYKGFSLSFLFEGRKGGVFYSRTRSLQEFIGTDPRTLLNDREPFVIPGSVIQTADNRFEANTIAVDAQDYWTVFSTATAPEQLIDASYIKLREVSLTYRLPREWFGKTKINGITIGLSGRNLWLWTPNENTYSDPETSSFGTGNTQGFDFGTIPSIRNYGVNIRVVF